MNIHRHPGVDSNRQHIKNSISSLTLEYLCKSMSISPHIRMIIELYKSYLWSLSVSLIVLWRFKNYDHQILQNRMSKITIILIIHDQILLSDWLLYQGPGSHLRQPSWPGAPPRPGSPQAIHRGRQLEAPRQDVEGARLAAAQGVQALLAHLGGRLGEKDEDFTGKPCETMGKWRLMGRMITTFRTCPMDFLRLTSGFRQQLSVKMGISQGQLVI